MISLLAGFTIKFLNNNPKSLLNQIGWGLLAGSLTSIGLLIIFIIFLSFNPTT